MANHPPTDWYANFTRLLTMIVTLVTMVLCGIGVTKYFRNRKAEILSSSVGVQTDIPDDPKHHGPPPAGSDIVGLG